MTALKINKSHLKIKYGQDAIFLKRSQNHGNHSNKRNVCNESSHTNIVNTAITGTKATLVYKGNNSNFGNQSRSSGKVAIFARFNQK